MSTFSLPGGFPGFPNSTQWRLEPLIEHSTHKFQRGYSDDGFGELSWLFLTLTPEQAALVLPQATPPAPEGSQWLLVSVVWGSRETCNTVTPILVWPDGTAEVVWLPDAMVVAPGPNPMRVPLRDVLRTLASAELSDLETALFGGVA